MKLNQFWLVINTFSLAMQYVLIASATLRHTAILADRHLI